MAKNELHIFFYFFTCQLWQKMKFKKSLNKFDPWMSMVRLSRWLWQRNVFVLIFDLVQHVAPLLRSGHWHNYFLQLGQAVRASVQSIFLRCLWTRLKAISIEKPTDLLHRGSNYDHKNNCKSVDSSKLHTKRVLLYRLQGWYSENFFPPYLTNGTKTLECLS